MSLQATLKTLETLRAEAANIRDVASRAPLAEIRPSVYDYWSGREAALADAIAELTKAYRPISEEAAGFVEFKGDERQLGEWLQRDHDRHRTVESDLAEDR